MTLEKLAKLRDKYAEKVRAYQDAQRTEKKPTITKAKKAMVRAGKTYLTAIDEAFLEHPKEDVYRVVYP